LCILSWKEKAKNDQKRQSSWEKKEQYIQQHSSSKNEATPNMVGEISLEILRVPVFI
jgi:hypothetical protein